MISGKSRSLRSAVYAPSIGQVGKESLCERMGAQSAVITFISVETGLESWSTTVLCHASRKRSFRSPKNVLQGRISELKKASLAIIQRKVEQGEGSRPVAMLILCCSAVFFWTENESVFSVVSGWFVNGIACLGASPPAL